MCHVKVTLREDCKPLCTPAPSPSGHTCVLLTSRFKHILGCESLSESLLHVTITLTCAAAPLDHMHRHTHAVAQLSTAYRLAVMCTVGGPHQQHSLAVTATTHMADRGTFTHYSLYYKQVTGPGWLALTDISCSDAAAITRIAGAEPQCRRLQLAVSWQVPIGH